MAESTSARRPKQTPSKDSTEIARPSFDWTSVAFVGETLGPLFLLEPQQSEIASCLLQAFREIDAVEATHDWPFVSEEEVTECLLGIREALAAATDDELAQEYRQLFLGPNKLDAPPYGSVYTDRDSVVEGDATIELRAWLDSRGIAERIDAFDQGERGRIIEDHIGRMFLLMAWIAREEPDLEREFLHQHLLPWAHHYFALLETASGPKFYGRLASLAGASLSGIAQALQVEVKQARFSR